MSKIIALSGTHGCGKTTAAYQLATKMKLMGRNVRVLDEMARECPLPINQEASENSQYWIITTQMKREIELSLKYPYIITDRTVVDTIAYAKVLGFHINFASGYLKNYYKIFLLDPDSFDFQVDDGVRSLDREFRMEVHNELVGLYKDYGVLYEVIRKVDLSEIDITKF